jgi:hypothetical protein
MSLSHDWTSLNNKIDAMVAAGTTNQPIGEQSDERAGAAVRHEADHHPADGRPEHPRPLEHQPSLYRRPRAGRLQQHQAYIDAREQAVCNNIKGAGITVYTVLVMSGNSSVLQGCASPDTTAPAGPKYFALTSASQIISTFNSIGINIAKLHMAK